LQVSKVSVSLKAAGRIFPLSSRNTEQTATGSFRLASSKSECLPDVAAMAEINFEALSGCGMIIFSFD